MENEARQPVSPPTCNPPVGIFTWYKNEADEGLEAVYRAERNGQSLICQVIHEFNDSYRYNNLRGLYTDAVEAARAANDSHAEDDALMALLARIYIAGTMRYYKMVQE